MGAVRRGTRVRVAAPSVSVRRSLSHSFGSLATERTGSHPFQPASQEAAILEENKWCVWRVVWGRHVCRRARASREEYRQLHPTRPRPLPSIGVRSSEVAQGKPRRESPG